MSKVKTNAELLNTPAGAPRTFDAEAFFSRNRNLLMGVLGAIAFGVVAYFGYSYYADSQEQEAQKALFAAVYYAEADSMKVALKGVKSYKGLEHIIKNYPNTKAGTLARFYAGVAYLKDGKFQKAIDELKLFNPGDRLVQGRAYALIGDAYLEMNKLEDAATHYKKASEYYPNEFFTPAYMIKLGLVYELQKKNQDAIMTYAKLIAEYPTSMEVANAKKFKGRLEGMMQK